MKLPEVTDGLSSFPHWVTHGARAGPWMVGPVGVLRVMVTETGSHRAPTTTIPKENAQFWNKHLLSSILFTLNSTLSLHLLILLTDLFYIL